MTLAPLDHVRGGGLGGVDHALEVGLQHALDVFRAVFDEGFGQEEASVVDQHVDLAEGVDAGLNQAAGGFRLGDVAGHADEGGAVQLCLGLGEASGGAGIADHIEATGEESLGQAEADAAGGAGDHYRFAVAHVVSPNQVTQKSAVGRTIFLL